MPMFGPALATATSGKVLGKPTATPSRAGHLEERVGYAVRKAQCLYFRESGAVNPGRSDTQFARAHPSSRFAKSRPVTALMFAVPTVTVWSICRVNAAAPAAEVSAPNRSTR